MRRALGLLVTRGGMATAKEDPFLGRELLGGQFRIVQRIGSGGMGSVYRAEEPAMGREVAIKILHPKLKGRQDLASRFRREARAMSQLAHPNTARVFSFGELPEDGSLYIVMEMLEGKNLNQTVRKGGPMTTERAIPILVQVCHALHEAHALGIVHRDLKPENIFLCRQAGMVDYPKVLDFGLAKVTEQQMRPGSLILTQEGMVFGTPEFMSPEQARGQTLDARSDIYSLAVILYEMLTGKLPFDAKTPMEYVGKHVTATPIPLSERVEGMTFPDGLGKVIAKALSKNPDERYQTATEFAAALGPFTVAKEKSVKPPVVEVRGPEAPVAFHPAQAVEAVSKGPGLGMLVTVAAACLLLGGLLAILVMKFLK
jgi:eukaryotic-like serine/threonine-protein kinase